MSRVDEIFVLRFILLAGMFLTIAFFVLGIILLFLNNGGDGYTLAQIASIRSTTDTIHSSMLLPSHFWKGLVTLDGAYYIAVGLWIMIFTPVAIVVTNLMAYLYAKNFLCALLGALILIIMFIAIIVVPRLV